MFKAIYVVFLIINILYNNRISCFDSFYGVKTNEYPKTSCHKFANIETAGRCLGTCGITMNGIVMISHDETTKTCMCCSDLTGSDITGPNWKSFVPRTSACATGYATYNYTDTQICLKYVSAPASYPEAAQHCQAEGGDLIKLDSKLKYEIMQDYLVPIADGVTIDVWIQGENVEGSLIFHDGSPFPTDIDTFCPLDLTDYPTDTRVRARGYSTFVCWDRSQDVPFSYLCEYYRRFTL